MTELKIELLVEKNSNFEILFNQQEAKMLVQYPLASRRVISRGYIHPEYHYATYEYTLNDETVWIDVIVATKEAKKIIEEKDAKANSKEYRTGGFAE